MHTASFSAIRSRDVGGLEVVGMVPPTQLKARPV